MAQLSVPGSPVLLSPDEPPQGTLSHGNCVLLGVVTNWEAVGVKQVGIYSWHRKRDSEERFATGLDCVKHLLILNNVSEDFIVIHK